MRVSGFKGHRHTKEANEKNRLAHLGMTAWNKGTKVSERERKRLIGLGKLGAKIRWKNHVKSPKIIGYRYTYKERYPNGMSARKRFTNQRYKARKRNALGSHTFEEWLALKSYYRNMCLCCKKQESDIKLTEDHIIPLSMGGRDDINNIQPLCQSCNTRKHAKIISYLPVGVNSSVFALPN